VRGGTRLIVPFAVRPPRALAFGTALRRGGRAAGGRFDAEVARAGSASPRGKDLGHASQRREKGRRSEGPDAGRRRGPGGGAADVGHRRPHRADGRPLSIVGRPPRRVRDPTKGTSPTEDADRCRGGWNGSQGTGRARRGTQARRRRPRGPRWLALDAHISSRYAGGRDPRRGAARRLPAEEGVPARIRHDSRVPAARERERRSSSVRTRAGCLSRRARTAAVDRVEALTPRPSSLPHRAPHPKSHGHGPPPRGPKGGRR